MINLKLKFIIGAVISLAVVAAIAFLMWRVDDLSQDNKEQKKEIAGYKTAIEQLNKSHAKNITLINRSAESAMITERQRSEILLEIQKYEKNDPASFDYAVGRLFFPAEATTGSDRNQTPGKSVGVQKP